MMKKIFSFSKYTLFFAVLVVAFFVSMPTICAASGTLSNFSYTSSDSNPGDTTTFTFNFTTQNDVSADPDMILYAGFPLGFNLTGVTSSNATVTVGGVTQSIAELWNGGGGTNLYIRLTSDVPAGSNVAIQLPDIVNPSSGGDYSYGFLYTADGGGNEIDAPQTLNPITITTPVTDISSVSITGFVAPVIDATPEISSALTPGSSEYTVTGLTWSPTDNPYASATQYTATVTLTSTAGYEFPSGGISPSSIALDGGGGTIANVVTTGTGTGNRLSFSYAFPSTAATLTLITSLDLGGYPAPYQGEMPPSSVGSNSPHYSVTGITWSPGDNPFQSNTEYTATITVTAAPGYEFYSDGIPVYDISMVSTGPAAYGNEVVTGQGSGNSLTFTASYPNYSQSVLDYAPGSNGSITGNASQLVAIGTDGTAVTAVPDTGYVFVNWSDNSTENPRTDIGTSQGVSVTANFASISEPDVATDQATSITQTGATFKGHIINNGGENATSEFFVYLTKAQYDNGQGNLAITTPAITGSFGAGTHFSTSVTGLSCGTQYVYGADATNSSPDVGPKTLQIFTTAACTSPHITTNTAATVVLLFGCKDPAAINYNPTSGIAPENSLCTYTNTPTSSTQNTGSSGMAASATSSGSSSFTFTITLKKGMTNTDVSHLQSFLDTHGFAVATTGPGSLASLSNYFGAKTKAALARYQASVDLPATGYFGPMTMQKVNSLLY